MLVTRLWRQELGVTTIELHVNAQRLVAQHRHGSHRLCSAMDRKSAASMAFQFQGMEINAKDFTGCVYHALRWLHRLGQAHLHANVKHRKAWDAASGVHVWVSEQLLADAFAHLLILKLRPRIDYLVLGLHDEERRLGRARGQL